MSAGDDDDELELDLIERLEGRDPVAAAGRLAPIAPEPIAPRSGPLEPAELDLLDFATLGAMGFFSPETRSTWATTILERSRGVKPGSKFVEVFEAIRDFAFAIQRGRDGGRELDRVRAALCEHFVARYERRKAGGGKHAGR